MIRKILVALDGSPRAHGVISAAIELGKRFEAKLYLFRAIQVPPEFPPSAHVSQLDTLPKYMEATAETEMLALVEGAGGIWEKIIVAHGQPSQAILAAAEANDVDLIVIGSHGYGTFDMVLGTTAGRVANLAKRNVFVVHDRKPTNGPL